MITTKQILKEIGCPHLEIVRGMGYWYFVYDTYVLTNALTYSGRYETRSVMLKNLNHMTLEQWVEDGKLFVKDVEEIK